MLPARKTPAERENVRYKIAGVRMARLMIPVHRVWEKPHTIEPTIRFINDAHRTMRFNPKRLK